MTNAVLTNWCVYLLRCADDSLYCGITNDLAKRITTHNLGKGARYTRVRLPVALVYSEPCIDRSTAAKREAAIKQLGRSAKLALIAEQSGVALVRQTNPA